MPHVTVRYSTERRAAAWREIHQALRQRLNVVVVPDTPGQADLVRRSLWRYKKQHHRADFLVAMREGVVAILFL